MSEAAIQAADVAEKYYDSNDADEFYSRVWGGEDIHIGLYRSPDEPIAEASRRTVAEMASELGLNADSTVIDIGAGYGGAARYLAKTFGCRVTCVNVSQAQNARNRRLNEQAGLADKIEVAHGTFERLPVPSSTYDVAWSQDAILHCGDRRRALQEIQRVLRPSGKLIFTDPMQSDTCQPSALAAVYARLHLSSLSSPGFYRETLAELGFRNFKARDLTEHLVMHYSRVHDELESRSAELTRHASSQYLASMKQGLEHWVKAGRDGQLRWGIFYAER